MSKWETIELSVVSLAILFALFILSTIYYQDKMGSVSDSAQPKKVSIVKMGNIPILKEIITPSVSVNEMKEINTPSVQEINTPSVQEINIPSVQEINIPSVKKDIYGGEEINKKLQEYTKKERELQKQYQLGFGKYKYNVLDGEQPIKGLYVDYMKNYKSTLPTICNKMVVEPDLNFPYANLLSK